MTTSATLGTMPVGGGPVGGLFPGTDYAGPQVIDIVPAPGSTGVNPQPTIEFDVIDFEGQLDVDHIRALVDGVVVFDYAQPQRFYSGWTGTAVVVPYGIHVEMRPPDFFGDGVSVTVVLTARDLSDNRVKRTWSFTTAEAATLDSVQVLSDRCLRLNFTPQVRVDGELYRPSNYAFATRLGYAKGLYAKTVTPPSTTPDSLVSSVVVCMKDYFSQNGRYSARVQGVHDEFGREIDVSMSFNA